MRAPVIIEEIPGGWGVSVGGSNPEAKYYVAVKDAKEAKHLSEMFKAYAVSVLDEADHRYDLSFGHQAPTAEHAPCNTCRLLIEQAPTKRKRAGEAKS